MLDITRIRRSRRTHKFASQKLSFPYDRQFMVISRLFTSQICRNHLVLPQNSIRAPVQIIELPSDRLFYFPTPQPLGSTLQNTHPHTYTRVDHHSTVNKLALSFFLVFGFVFVFVFVLIASKRPRDLNLMS